MAQIKRVCSKCFRDEDAVEFHSYFDKVRNVWRTKPWCKGCVKSYNKANWARKHPDTGRTFSSQMKFDRRKRNYDFLDQIKSTTPCKDCGNVYPPYVMDFDHKDRTLKTDRLSNMASRGLSLETIKKELTNCDVVCANCHRIRTHDGEHWRKVGAEGLEPSRLSPLVSKTSLSAIPTRS